ncbi:MAG: acyltransferase [Fulvimarina manganoxydans]|uniref:acyltransferase n=1 Tax=Fulvimarina manganoxydans TaxID=937218 RepID=UPI0023559171|nr:acyltransferase [Fulvimarina manganoxydans]MCK5931300.1 acyltransferase [Fulvimarina manganoxydans]
MTLAPQWLKDRLAAFVDRRIAAALERRDAERPKPGPAEIAGRIAADPDALRALRQGLMQTPGVWGERGRLHVGENVHLVDAVLNTSSGTITIGDHSFFGHGVSLITGTHFIEKDGIERQTYPTEGRDIVIGHSVWIASNAVVLGPCRIGDRAVIAAGAIVRSDVEAGAIVAGVPARKVGSV